jgi:hypothetical protein
VVLLHSGSGTGLKGTKGAKGRLVMNSSPVSSLFGSVSGPNTPDRKQRSPRHAEVESATPPPPRVNKNLFGANYADGQFVPAKGAPGFKARSAKKKTATPKAGAKPSASQLASASSSSSAAVSSPAPVSAMHLDVAGAHARNASGSGVSPAKRELNFTVDDAPTTRSIHFKPHEDPADDGGLQTNRDLATFHDPELLKALRMDVPKVKPHALRMDVPPPIYVDEGHFPVESELIEAHVPKTAVIDPYLTLQRSSVDWHASLVTQQPQWMAMTLKQSQEDHSVQEDDESSNEAAAVGHARELSLRSVPDIMQMTMGQSLLNSASLALTTNHALMRPSQPSALGVIAETTDAIIPSSVVAPVVISPPVANSPVPRILMANSSDDGHARSLSALLVPSGPAIIVNDKSSVNSSLDSSVGSTVASQPGCGSALAGSSVDHLSLNLSSSTQPGMMLEPFSPNSLTQAHPIYDMRAGSLVDTNPYSLRSPSMTLTDSMVSTSGVDPLLDSTSPSQRFLVAGEADRSLTDTAVSTTRLSSVVVSRIYVGDVHRSLTDSIADTTTTGSSGSIQTRKHMKVRVHGGATASNNMQHT